MSVRRKVALGALGAALVGGLIYMSLDAGYSWDDLEETLLGVPGWIFIVMLLFLPPVGVPLTVFMLVVGARFGYFMGVGIASAAVFGHHLLAIGLNSVMRRWFGEAARGRDLWSRLEKKVGEDHMGKLIFLFALIPGPPYLIKLYLPLAMGVSRKLYFWCSGSAHLVGVALFVGLGRALLQGNGLLIFIFILALALLYVVVGIIRRKQTGEAEREEAKQKA